MDTTEGQVTRGVQADALLSNSLFREVLNQLDEIYTASWRAATTVEAREDCFRYVRLIERLIEDIQSISNTGKLAQLRIMELERGKVRMIDKWRIRD